MERNSLTLYEEYPHSMLVYLRHYGPHFNRKLCEFAISKMKNKDGKITPLNKDTVTKLLENNKIELEHNQLYDFLYVANMCIADFLGSSIIDEKHLALYIKDVIDDSDGFEGMIFNRWYADMSFLGISIDWEEML